MRSQSDGQDYLPHSESFLRSLLWQDTRLDLIRDVLAHPQHAPSLTELYFVNEFTDPADIRFQLSMLVEYGILTRRTYDGSDAPEDGPRTFYTLTDDGWAVVRHFNDQFTPHMYERLSEMYSRAVATAPEHVQAARDAPRPAGGPSDD